MTLPAPYWQSECGRYTLYHGDCLAILPHLTGVDAVVTDIPYGEVNRDSGGLRNLDKGNADTETFSHEWAASSAATLGKSVYIWCGTEQVSGIRSALVCAGMTTRLCVWEKTNPSPMNGDKLWLSSLETCVFGRHPLAPWNEHCNSPCWRGPIQRDQVHPTQKPEWLIRIPIEASTPADGTVLDFCAGSGTTGVACVRTGRRFIGIEIEEKYCAIARRRIEAEMNNLFDTAPRAKEVQHDIFAETT